MNFGNWIHGNFRNVQISPHFTDHQSKYPMVKVKSLNLARLSVAKYEEVFHSATRFALLAARLMGMVPLTGLTSTNSEDIRYSLRLPYGLLYLLTLTGQLLIFVFSIIWLVDQELSLNTITTLLHYTLCVATVLNLAVINRSWPGLIAKVRAIESTLPPLRRNIAFVCNLTLVLLLISGTVEHVTREVLIAAIAKTCEPDNIAETYFRYNRAWIIRYTSFSWFKLVCIEIISKQVAFLWNYCHEVVMLVSIYLAEHFETHNRLLRKASKEVRMAIGDFFSCNEFRAQYSQLSCLVQLINERFGVFMVLSLGSNLYWTCNKVFYCLNKIPEAGTTLVCPSKQDIHIDAVSVEYNIFSVFSLIFVITRSTLVLVLASRVHSLSLEPLTILYEIPAHKFNTDIERYIDQVLNTKIALTGLGFFKVTRTMILSFFATIVTYELVMLQF